MIGSGILSLALESEDIISVTSLVRNSSGIEHPKLKEIVLTDFGNYTNLSEELKGISAAYFCIGAYTGKLSDAMFKTVTVDYAVAFAQALKAHSPHARLCLLSGAGADRTEKSKAAFAKYKGMAENQIGSLGLAFHSFRPGYIYPVQARKEPNILYRILRFCYPILKLFGEKYSIPSTQLSKAMFVVGMEGHSKIVLENIAIVSVISNHEGK